MPREGFRVSETSEEEGECFNVEGDVMEDEEEEEDEDDADETLEE